VQRDKVDHRLNTPLDVNVERAADTEPVGAGLAEGAKRSGVIPPTGKSCASFGSTARQAFTTSGGVASAGKSLRTEAAWASAAKLSLGVATPGSATRSNSNDIGGQEHRAGAHEDAPAPFARERLDALQRLRRIERDLDRAEASLDQGRGDRLGLVWLKAAEGKWWSLPETWIGLSENLRRLRGFGWLPRV